MNTILLGLLFVTTNAAQSNTTTPSTNSSSVTSKPVKVTYTPIKVTTSSPNPTRDDSSIDCWCEKNGNRRRLRLGIPYPNTTYHYTYYVTSTSLVPISTTEYDDDDSVSNNNNNSNIYSNNDSSEDNNNSTSNNDSSNNNNNGNNDDSSVDGCPCASTTTKPVPSCPSGYAAGNTCWFHTDCPVTEYCDSLIGGYCCLEMTPWSQSDVEQKGSTFGQIMTKYKEENIGMFVLIIVGMGIGMFGLICLIIFLISKLIKKNSKYARVDVGNNGKGIDVTRTSISANEGTKNPIKVNIDDESDESDDEFNMDVDDPTQGINNDNKDKTNVIDIKNDNKDVTNV